MYWCTVGNSPDFLRARTWRVTKRVAVVRVGGNKYHVLPVEIEPVKTLDATCRVMGCEGSNYNKEKCMRSGLGFYKEMQSKKRQLLWWTWTITIVLDLWNYFWSNWTWRLDVGCIDRTMDRESRIFKRQLYCAKDHHTNRHRIMDPSHQKTLKHTLINLLYIESFI